MNAPIDRKTWANLQARAALAGIVLQRLFDEGGAEVYVATRAVWALTRQLDSVDSLEAFLTRSEAVCARRKAA